ncbi:peptidoglycan-binding protein [Profundibacter sp.]
MNRTCFISTILSGVFFGTVALSNPVLTNGGFEQNPPGGYGNHIGWDISPWVLGGGNSSNVVSVDGPGGQTSYENANLGPGFDATGGAGHYLDIAGGSNDFYQEFTPLCSGEVQFGAYFSTRDNRDGTAVVTIKDATGSTDISAPATVNLPGGTSGTDPWTLASFTTTLTANTTYRFHVQMDNNMNMDNAFVNFGPSCTEHEDFPHDPIPDPEPLTDVEVQKICDPIEYAENGDFVLACHLNVQASEPFPSTISINDSFTLNTAAVSAINSTENWACSDSVSGGSLDVACTLPVSDIPASGASTIDVTMTFPADTPPEGLYNCADGTFEIAGTEPHTIEESCVRIDLPEQPEPVQCLAFEPELSCNTKTGQIEVVLSNTLSGSFGADDVKVTSQTSGVGLSSPDPSNPMLVALSGVVPGQTLSLLIDAVETGGGSAPGLDKCCLGENELEIPQDFTCEKDPLLEIDKICHQVSDHPVYQSPWCEIIVHYEGPAPTDTNPITLGEMLTSGGATLGMPLSSGDNWQCTGTNAESLGCTISESDAPGTDWSDWTSTLTIPVVTSDIPGDFPLPDGFENCASVSIGDVSAEDCWSNDIPQLEIGKTGPEICYLGEPCEFTYTITNTSTDQNFDGGVMLSDVLDFTSGNGSFTPTDGGIVSMDPPLCTAAELNSGSCNAGLSLGAGQSQTYTVSYVPPPYALANGDYSLENCVELATDDGSSSQDCATVQFQPPRLSLEKNGPSQCAIGETCDFTITISAGDQPFSGNVLLMDSTNVPAFDITAISPPTAGCGANLPANPLFCVVPVNLPANGSISYTISITPQSPQNQVVAESGENCAYIRSLPAGNAIAPGDYSFNQYATPPNFPPQMAEMLQGGMMGESCVWFDVPDDTGQTDTGSEIDMAIAKTWAAGADFLGALEPGDNAQIPPHGYIIDVSQVVGSLQAGDVITVTDPASGQSGITFFGAPYAPAPWFCTMSGSDMTCSYTVPADGPANPPAILWPAVNDPAVDSTNCANVAVYSGSNPDPLAETNTQNNSACVTIHGEQAVEPVQPEITVEKQCEPIIANTGGLEMSCTITVQALNDFTHELRIIDMIHQVAGSTGTLASITPPNGGWSCNNNSCIIDSANFGTGDTAVFNVVISGPDTGETTTWRNCGDVNWVTNGGNTAAYLTNNCDVETYEQGQRIQLPTGDGVPRLVLSKTANGPCSVNRASQSYTCDFRLEVANRGNGAFSGPLVLSEIFGKPAPLRLTGNSDGWTCNPAAADGSTCQTDRAILGVGETGGLDVTLTLPGLPQGGQFENCASLGVTDNLRDQAMILQRIMQMRGIDGGPVDGKPGRKTRAGLRLLQQQLGLEPTGKIDTTLFAALGLSAAMEQTKECVTVDLPSMPEPLLQCNRDTTVARGGECVCRYARMVRKGNNACACVRGTRFVAGKGCIPTSSGKPDTATPKPATCPKGTEYVRGKGCVKPRQACPNGRPRHPLLGCTNVTITIGDSGSKPKDGH